MKIKRNSREIHKAYAEHRDRVCWNRHQDWIRRILKREVELTREQKPVLKKAIKVAKKIEMKYGRENLVWNEFERGLVYGKLSALQWLLGVELEPSLVI